MADTRTALQRTLENLADTDGGLVAGENFIGLVGNSSIIVTVAPTVNTAAYVVGDTLGGKQTIAGALRVAGTYTRLKSITIVDASAQLPTGTILFFNGNPTAATTTDHAAFVLSTDKTKLVAAIAVATADYATVSGVGIATLEMDLPLTATTGTSLYAVWVTDDTTDFVAATDLVLHYGFERS